jgi:hypothetical protein
MKKHLAKIPTKAFQTVPILIIFLVIIIRESDFMANSTLTLILLPLIPISLYSLAIYKKRKKTEENYKD